MSFAAIISSTANNIPTMFKSRMNVMIPQMITKIHVFLLSAYLVERRYNTTANIRYKIALMIKAS